MIAQTILTSTVFFFPLSDLMDLGLHPHALTQNDAIALIRSSCLLPEQHPAHFSEIQVFSTHDGVLLFLRPHPVCPSSQANSFGISS